MIQLILLFPMNAEMSKVFADVTIDCDFGSEARMLVLITKTDDMGTCPYGRVRASKTIRIRPTASISPFHSTVDRWGPMRSPTATAPEPEPEPA